MTIQEHVARKLCRAANMTNFCLICDDDRDHKRHGSECQIWETFLKEADAAISGVRDFALLNMRSKPRI